MLKKYHILLLIVAGNLLLLMAVWVYPGGSQHDPNAVGFHWQHNYLSNLFKPLAVNGMANASRPWATLGMLLMCVGYGLGFIGISKKMPQKSAEHVVKFAGAGAMIGVFGAATPWHDLLVMLASPLALLAIFYITVFAFRAKLHALAVFCVLLMLSFYFGNYVYGARHLLYLLPTVQRVVHVLLIVFVLWLTYGIRAEDFQPVGTNKA
jgi:hypothetical protein